MKIQYLLVVFLLVFPNFLTAQNESEIFIKLIDSESSEPISFATVRFKGTSKGLIADFNGEFRIPKSYQETDQSLIISSIGYRSLELLISDFKTTGINTVQLVTQVEILEAVVINNDRKRVAKVNSMSSKDIVKAFRRMNSKEIVIKAIQRIPENLSNQAHSYIGYYRDYQLVDNEFHNLNEGIFETFDQGIQTNALEENKAPTAAYILKQNPNFKQDASLARAYNGSTKYIEHSEILARGGNEFTILNTHNPIRSFNVNTFSYVYTLEKQFPDLHKFSKEEIVYLDNEPLAVISFVNTPIQNNDVYGMKTQKTTNVFGSIYISLVDYSIHRFNYKVLIPRTKKVLFNVSLEYARQDDHMYLNYITFNNQFVIAEDFILKEERVVFDKGDQAFYITFNNTEDKIVTNTINPENFKFKLGKKRLNSVTANKISERVIKVEVKSYDAQPIDVNSDNVKDLSITIKNVEDVKGRRIYEAKAFKGDQFREFFIQQVNLNKSIPNDLQMFDQNMPLESAPQNSFSESMRFWVNSPLMNKKYRDTED